MGELVRLTDRFEIAVGNFVRSCFDLLANEKAFQAWFAASVIQEFGLSRVFREVHLDKRQLAQLVPPGLMEGFARGNELFPDLSISWEEAIDARHTQARSDELDAGGMLSQFGIISEFKVTSSTARPTPPRAIRTDIRKLGLLAAAHQKIHPASELATYLVILDNHRTSGSLTARYRPERISRLLESVARDWQGGPMPTVLVGEAVDGHVVVSTYRDEAR